jgi:transposase InsO family protein
LQRPLEYAQHTSIDYTQVLDDHGILASVGSVGDAYDNSLAESFVDSYKTELITDRVWQTRSSSSWPPSNTSPGSTTSGYTPPSATPHPPNTKPATRLPQPAWHEHQFDKRQPPKTVSGKPGAAQVALFDCR